MPVNLSIKNVPDELADRLRDRARRSHRSIQGELMAILERALRQPRRLSPLEVLARVREMELATPDEAVAMIRADREKR